MINKEKKKKKNQQGAKESGHCAPIGVFQR